VQKVLGKVVDEKEFVRLVSSLGTPVESVEGDVVSLEINPNRPDLLSEQGFLRAFSALTGKSPGLKTYAVRKSGTFCKVEKTLKIWPYVVCAIVKGLSFDDERIRDVIQVQEKLGMTLLRNRKKGGIGIYPLDKIVLPITFTTMRSDEIRFRPLEFGRELSGRQILGMHPTGRKYAHIIEDQEKFPVFLDSAGTIMSMPPIINSDVVGKIDLHTKDIFIEATGPDLRTLHVALNIIVTMCADMGGKVLSLEIRYKGKSVTTPDLAPRTMKVQKEYIERRVGMKISEDVLKRALARMGHSYMKGKIAYPPYRADILHQIDFVEDFAIGFGYEQIPAVIPRVATIGHEDPLEVLKEKLRDVLTGLGLLEVKRYALESRRLQNERVFVDQALVELENSWSEEREVLRRHLMPSLLSVLEENKHHEYPQRIFELGVVFSPESMRVVEEEHLCIALASAEEDYTRIKQSVIALLDSLGLKCETRQASHPSFIEGRFAELVVGKAVVGFLGEVHPKVLEKFGLSVPVAVAELRVKSLLDLL
jgi:phenylalanyl-tRNA synthetase beta chain